MAKKTERVISVRVPEGLVEELRARTGVPISTLVRAMLTSMLNNERKKDSLKQQQESPTDGK